MGGWYKQEERDSEARTMEPTMEAGLEPAGGMKTVPGPVVQIDEGRIQAHLEELCSTRPMKVKSPFF